MGGHDEQNGPGPEGDATGGRGPVEPQRAEDDLIGDQWMKDDGGEVAGEAQAGASAEVARLRAELEETKSRLMRLMADFQNYERRALLNQARSKQDGVSEVALGVVGVLDSFDMAISHDLTTSSPEQLVAGMRVIRDELLRSVGRFGVVVINPATGEEFQPGRHEAIMQKAEDGIESGHIVRTFQAGYVLGERVLRPAKVAVAP